MADIILECKNIYKSFSGVNVLNGIDLQIKKGDFVSILGESGSGKSTLLSILGGMDVPTEGEVVFNGAHLETMKEKELAKLRRTKIGFVFQFFNLASLLTVKENILLPLIHDGKSIKPYEKRLQDLISYLKLNNLVNKLPKDLSGGEQQRVAIARGLIFEPELILLDEPTGNLDSKNSDEIMNLLCQINNVRGTTIIQVTHSEKNAKYGNKIINIKDGRIPEVIVLKDDERMLGEDIRYVFEEKNQNELDLKKDNEPNTQSEQTTSEQTEDTKTEYEYINDNTKDND